MSACIEKNQVRKRYKNVEFRFERVSSFLNYVPTTEGADHVGVDVRVGARVASSLCGFFLNQRMSFD